MQRRQFLKNASLATLYAGRFSAKDFGIPYRAPLDKKLDPAWLAALFERGKPTVYAKSRDELKYIGMPCGGIGCGTMYVGGDGRLWLWDIFNDNRNGIDPKTIEWHLPLHVGNTVRAQDGANFVQPPRSEEKRPVQQGFQIRVLQSGKNVFQKGLSELDNWAEITFTAAYPLASIEFSDPAAPVTVWLRVFSPFIPMDEDNSSLPATVVSIEVLNKTEEKIEVFLDGWLENAIGKDTLKHGHFEKKNLAIAEKGLTAVHLTMSPEQKTPADLRPDILLGDFENGTFDLWKKEGDAFGEVPFEVSEIEKITGKLGAQGNRVANSYNTRLAKPGENPDDFTGRLLREPFKIERRYLTFLIGGGNHPGKVGVRLRSHGTTIFGVTGLTQNQMRREIIDMQDWQGKEAVLEVYDAAKGAWGQIGVDDFRLTDNPLAGKSAEKAPDFGSMCLALLGKGTAHAAPFFKQKEDGLSTVTYRKKMRPGQLVTADFAVAWHFPNTHLDALCPDAHTGHLYAQKFPDALAVARYLGDNQRYLFETTRLFHRTWYSDSSLPHWFLERTLLNVSTLATTTCHRFGSGRFWAWEGVGCCAGTCTHVWQYAHSAARLFPALERDQRQRVDLGLGFDLSNMIVMHRGEGSGPAIDGQAGTVLRIFREHQMCPDDAFLKKNWRNIRRAVEWILQHDHDGDGLPDGSQDHTLDAAWFGQIAWISGLCLAALRAGEEMAVEAGDPDFAARCRAQFEKGKIRLESHLFNGEYFIQIPDPEKGRRTLGSYNTCHIDQVFGQSWAFQVGLGRVTDREKTLSALRSLWKYNFMPDVGPYIAERRGWRPYALAGDGGMVMNTNPRNEDKPWGEEVTWQAGYFAECMSGFEHQVAAHLMAEGMVEEAMTLTRCIHDRYHAARRNPFNEIECSDHYARAMASHGTYLTACGFRSHGPKGFLAFAPKIGAKDFRAAFTAAGGWGLFSQKMTDDGTFSAEIEIRFGKTMLKHLHLELPGDLPVGRTLRVSCGKKNLDLKVDFADGLDVWFSEPLVLGLGERLEVRV